MPTERIFLPDKPRLKGAEKQQKSPFRLIFLAELNLSAKNRGMCSGLVEWDRGCVGLWVWPETRETGRALTEVWPEIA